MAQNHDGKKSKVIFLVLCFMLTGYGGYKILLTAKETVENAKNTTATKIERALKGAE